MTRSAASGPGAERRVRGAVARALEVVAGASREGGADIEPTRRGEEGPAGGCGGRGGAVGAGPAPWAPAVEAPSPRVALAVFPLAVLAASMFTPGWSVALELGAWGYSLAA